MEAMRKSYSERIEEVSHCTHPQAGIVIDQAYLPNTIFLSLPSSIISSVLQTSVIHPPYMSTPHHHLFTHTLTIHHSPSTHPPFTHHLLLFLSTFDLHSWKVHTRKCSLISKNLSPKNMQRLQLHLVIKCALTQLPVQSLESCIMHSPALDILQHPMCGHFTQATFSHKEYLLY